MQFTVPQFIEEESKIIGPLSFRQIIYIGVAIAISAFIWFSVNNIALFIFLSLPIMAIGISLALLKVNKTALPTLIKNFFEFYSKPKIYLWRRRNERIQTEKTIQKKEAPPVKKPPINLIKKSRIGSLSDEIDSKGKIN